MPTQPSQDVFRFVALRGPDTTKFMDPESLVPRNDRVGAVRRLGLRLQQSRKNREAESEVLTQVRGLKPLTLKQVNDMPWSSMVRDFANDTAADVNSWDFVLAGAQRVTVRDYAGTSRFADERAALTSSWLELMLQRRAGIDIAPETVEVHRTALLFADVMQRVGEGTFRAGDGITLFRRLLVRPAAWPRLEQPERATTVDAPNLASYEAQAGGGKSSTSAAAVVETPANTGQEVVPPLLDRLWNQITRKALSESSLGAAAVAGTHDSSALRSMNRVDPRAVEQEAHLLRRILIRATLLDASGVGEADFKTTFVNSLSNELSREAQQAFTLFRARHHLVDFTKLVEDLHSDAQLQLSHANELCRQMQVFETDQEQTLPPPGAPTSQVRPAIRALGWGDLLVVREKLIGYEASEISHIENVLAGESSRHTNERRHRVQILDGRETTTDTITENALSTTDRFELQTEAAHDIASDFSGRAGITTSGRYGPVQVDTSVTGEITQSTKDSTTSAQKIAEETVAKSVTRTQEKVRSLRRTVTTDSLRDLTQHAIENTAEKVTNPQARTEIYRWATKILRLQMYQYGKRLMFEFAIPEPGLSLIEAGQPLRPTVRKPLPLPIGPSGITEGNYLCLTDKYRARDIPPPPPLLIQIGEAFATERNNQDDQASASATAQKKLTVPRGYEPISGQYAATGRGRSEEEINTEHPDRTLDWMQCYLAVGGEVALDSVMKIPSNFSPGGAPSYQGKFCLTAPSVTDQGGIPLTVRWAGAYQNVATMNVYLTCRRTDAALAEWQLQVYQRLLDAVERLQAEYQEALRQAAYDESQVERAFGYRPSEQNRALERVELKKWAIALIRGMPFSNDPVAGYEGVQEIDPVKADLQAPVVRFFEESFEWDQMTYMLAPYFWGRRASWFLRQSINVPNDPQHEAFLRAGSARVIVPVTAGHEARLLTYLQVTKTHPKLPEWDPNSDPNDWTIDVPTQRIRPTPLDLASLDPDEVTELQFPGLWLELIDEYKPEVLRGSGKVTVQHGDKVGLLKDSVEQLNSRDIGRDIYIDGDQYAIASVQGNQSFTLDRQYDGDSGDRVYAVGSVARGAPWEVRIPTTLLVLSENTAALDVIP